MNRKLLERVKEAILAEPEEFDMDYYLNVNCNVNCQTAQCIAGWAISINAPKKFEQIVQAHREHRAIAFPGKHIGFFSWGMATLRLNVIEAESLFYADDWPYELRKRYDNAKTATERAQVAAERIDYFLEKGL